MLQIQLIRENPSEVIERLKVKNFDATELIQKILDTDALLRQAKRNLDNNLMEQGKLAKSIG
ncbi:MAG: serine--tRNA ligase, partial [Bacteroidales bacterium]|nr:serine--tRNA ligase [Bacteroidales bacterium]